MPDFLNTGTGKPEALDGADAIQGLALGTHTPVGGKALVNPRGRLVISPESDVTGNLQNGYAVPTQDQLNGFADQAKYGLGAANPLITFGEAALRSSTLGLSDAMPGKYGRAKRMEYNPTAETLGGFVGAGIGAAMFPESSPVGLLAKGGEAITGALTPAALGEGASLAAKVLQGAGTVGAKTAGSAAVGAAFGLGQTASEAFLGDPNAAAEHLVSNVGFGAAFGGAFGGLIGSVKLGADAASDTGLTSNLVKKIAKVTTGLDERAFERYAARPEQVNAAGSLQDVVDNFLTKVGDAQGEVSYGSSRGYKLLENSGKSFNIADITQPMIDAAARIEERGGKFSPKLQAAMKDVLAIGENAENVAAKTGGQLTGPEVKSILQTFDNETKNIWKQGLGSEAQAGTQLRMARGEIDGVLKSAVPEYAEHMLGVAADTRALKDLSGKFRTPGGAANLLKRIMNGKDEFAARALNNFDEQFGTTFADDLKDSWAKSSFSKETTQGSRKTMLGGVLGHFLGGGTPFGSAAGAAVGAAADKYGTSAIKKLIDGVEYAKTKLGNPTVTLEHASQMFGGLATKLVSSLGTATIGTAIHLLSPSGPHSSKQNQLQALAIGKLERSTQESANNIAAGAGSLFTQPDPHAVEGKVGISEAEYEANTKKVQDLASNPEALIDKLDMASRDMFNIAPKTTQEVHSVLLRGAEFLSTKLPVQRGASLPFDGKYKPSRAEMAKFSRYYKTVENPLRALDELRHGSISPETKETLTNVYPRLYQEMQSNVLEALAKYKAKKTQGLIPYQRQLAISDFLGQPLESAMLPMNLAQNRAILSQTNAQNKAKAAAQVAGPSAKGLSKIDVASRLETARQAATARTSNA